MRGALEVAGNSSTFRFSMMVSWVSGAARDALWSIRTSAVSRSRRTSTSPRIAATALPYATRVPARAQGSSRRQVPERPPDFSQSATASMVIVRSADLHMS